MKICLYEEKNYKGFVLDKKNEVREKLSFLEKNYFNDDNLDNLFDMWIIQVNDDDTYDEKVIELIKEKINFINNLYCDYNKDSKGSVVKYYYKNLNSDKYVFDYIRQKSSNFDDYIKYFSCNLGRIIKSIFDLNFEGKIFIKNFYIVKNHGKNIDLFDDICFIEGGYNNDLIFSCKNEKTGENNFFIPKDDEKIERTNLEINEPYLYKNKFINTIFYDKVEICNYSISLFFGECFEEKNNRKTIYKGLFYYFKNDLCLLKGIKIEDDKISPLFTVPYYSFYDDIFKPIEQNYLKKDEIQNFLSNTNFEKIYEINDEKLKFLSEMFDFDDNLNKNIASQFISIFDSSFDEKINNPYEIKFKNIIWQRAESDEGDICLYCSKIKEGLFIYADLLKKISFSHYDFVGMNEWKNNAYILKFNKDVDKKYELKIVLYDNCNDALIIYKNKNYKFSIKFNKLSNLFENIDKTLVNSINGIGDYNNLSYGNLKDDLYNLDIKIEKFIDEIEKILSDNNSYNMILSNDENYHEECNNFSKIYNMLYKANEIANEDLVTTVDLYYKRFLDNIGNPFCKNKDGNIPLFAIVGENGVGKTTISSRVPQVFYKSYKYINCNILNFISIDNIFEYLVNIFKKSTDNNEIIILDGLENITNEEIVNRIIETMLLFISNKTKINFVIKENSENYITKKFYFNSKIIIWLVGNEEYIYSLFNKHKNLNNYYNILNIGSFSYNELYEYLIKKVIYTNEILTENEEVVRKIFVNKYYILEDIIKNYFRWVKEKNHNEYFANFNGVNKFYEKLATSLNKNMNDEKIIEVVKEIIDNSKREIERQILFNK